MLFRSFHGILSRKPLGCVSPRLSLASSWDVIGGRVRHHEQEEKNVLDPTSVKLTRPVSGVIDIKKPLGV